MKKLIMLFAIITMATITLIGCTKDDSNETKYDEETTSIVGLWEITHVKGYYALDLINPPTNIDADITQIIDYLTNEDNYITDNIQELEYLSTIIECFYFRYEFTPTNFTYMYEFNWKKWVRTREEFIYTIRKDKIRIYEDVQPWTKKLKTKEIYDANIDNTFTIVKLTNNELILYLDSKNSNICKVNGITDQYVTLTLKRIY